MALFKPAKGKAQPTTPGCRRQKNATSSTSLRIYGGDFPLSVRRPRAHRLEPRTLPGGSAVERTYADLGNCLSRRSLRLEVSGSGSASSSSANAASSWR
jgi:hypothetical protein